MAASGYLQYSYIGDPTGAWDGTTILGGYRRQQHLEGRDTFFITDISGVSWDQRKGTPGEISSLWDWTSPNHWNYDGMSPSRTVVPPCGAAVSLLIFRGGWGEAA